MESDSESESESENECPCCKDCKDEYSEYDHYSDDSFSLINYFEVERTCFVCSKLVCNICIKICCRICIGGWTYNCICCKKLRDTMRICECCFHLEKVKYRHENNIKLERRIRKKTELEKELRKIKLKFRKDSKLCCNYINDTIDRYELKNVIHTMAEMHYLYNYTDYPLLTKSYYKEHRELNTLKKKYKMPKRWPWMIIKLKTLVKIIILFIRHREDYYKIDGNYHNYLKLFK
jgi:hypothetical protein